MRRIGLQSLQAALESKRDREDTEDLSCGICLMRVPIMPMLIVGEKDTMFGRSFRSPLEGHVTGVSAEFKFKTLGLRLKKSINIDAIYSMAKIDSPPKPPTDTFDPSTIEPIILFDPEKDHNPYGYQNLVQVDPVLARFLRPHQKEGVKFVFDCLVGLRHQDFYGCILADDMGLGKTLQSITIMWTLLKQSLFENGPSVTPKCLIVCPASLVKNWSSEIEKWLNNRCGNTPVAESCKDKVAMMFKSFRYDTKSLVLISSYETFRLHANKLNGTPIDLVICDEAHRLKNDKSKTSIAINNLKTKRRLLLSGTPIQNDLEEFYALSSLCNPDILGDINLFRKNYIHPILRGREPDSTKKEQDEANQCLLDLSELTNKFILRRTNTLLAKVLPPKLIMNIFCRMTPLQTILYKALLESKLLRNVLKSSGEGGKLMSQALSSIQVLMKLCNHPVLLDGNNLLDDVNNKDLKGLVKRISGFATKNDNYSGKFLLCRGLLHSLRSDPSKDRIVIISNYTQTLDLFQKLCDDNRYPCIRLDGGTSIKKRHELVTKFNDPTQDAFVFLLSSKAGGCGINLIGANRLIMYDADWNPANDKQALARVWRDGQKKQCYIYRLFSTGTLEEKIFQRQLAKDNLSSMVVSDGKSGDQALRDCISSELIKNLFQTNPTTLSDTHDVLNCTRCPITPDMAFPDNHPGEEDSWWEPIPQMGNDEFDETELLSWSHHCAIKGVDDNILGKAYKLCMDDAFSKERLEDAAEYQTPPNFSPISFTMAARIDFSQLQSSAPEEPKTTTAQPSVVPPIGNNPASNKLLQKIQKNHSDSEDSGTFESDISDDDDDDDGVMSSDDD